MVVVSIVLFVFSLIIFWISYRQFNEKGIVFNNAYLYASRKEREQMNLSPYYRQSAIVFVMVGLIILVTSISIYLKEEAIMVIVYALTVLVIIYAIYSTVIIQRKNQKDKIQGG